MSKKRGGPWATVTAACVLVGIGAGIASIWAWPAYTFRFGDQVVVSYSGPCETSYGRRGGSTTDCPATWTVDGREVRGKLTDSAGEDIRGEDGALVTSVWGTTARTRMKQPEYLLGMFGPWVLLGAIGLGVASGAMERRRPPAEPAAPELTPELQALNLGRPVAQYTGTTPYGWFVFGTLLLVPLGYSLAQGIETPVEYGIAGAGLVAAVMGVRKVRRKKAWRATFFTGGLHVRQDKRVFTCRWNEVTAVLAAVTISGAAKLHRYTVWRNAEESLVIEDGWEDVGDLGQRLVREANEAMLPRYVESFEAGVALKFGNLLVNRDGVGAGNAFLPWQDVTHFALSNGMVEIRGGAVREQQAVADTPNVPILLALADGARRQVTRVE